MDDCIELRGVRVNNLKNIDLDIPRDKFIVIAGVSGSGKSSLAFDTLYAEGQRRYVESLSSYARLFLGRMNKPDCDSIRGLPPAIAISQRVVARNPRSTVGTSTEIYDYMRALFANIGKTVSPVSGNEVSEHTAEDVLERVMQFADGTVFALLAPLHLPEGRTVRKQMDMYLQQGYTRLWHKGEFVRIDDIVESSEADLPNADDTFLLIDRMSVSRDKDAISRLLDSAETAMYEGHGACRLVFLPSNLCYDFSSTFESDGITFEHPTDNMFSFNSPLGACPCCEGFGKIIGIDEKLVVPNSSLSVFDGCVQCWHGEKMGIWQTEFCRKSAADKFPIFTPYNELSRRHKDMLWHGLPSERNTDERDRVCIDNFFRMLESNQHKIQYRVMLSRYRGKTICPKCHGTRIKEEANWVKIAGRSISDLVQMPIQVLRDWFDTLPLSEHDAQVGKRPLKEIRDRLHFLCDVGLGYLTLNRPANTLSGGESQRITITKSLGSALVGSIYILDEPSIGLHSRDTHRLIDALRNLQAQDNTVVVVEHDEDMIRSADYLIDVGPEAGRHGGEIVFKGNINDIDATAAKRSNSHTLKYFFGDDGIAIPASRRNWNMAIELRGARMNNLRGIDVRFPLNVITAVTGVSGSGKSSLVKGILLPALKRHLGEVADSPGEYASLGGDWREIKRVEFVDQSALGKSTRSNPATYVKAYDAIRALFSKQQLAVQMGFTPQYFSFNAEGGRCEECKGAGVINIEMQFLADLTLVCDQCHGKRFKRDILGVRFHDKNISDVLDMTVEEAIAFFNKYGERAIARRLKVLDDVGLGYIKLGQNSSSLSGGENQRVKLACFVGQERNEPTLFIFDEPTTGLHAHDIKKLLKAFNTLIEHGHSIVVIEHNLDVVKSADYVIDLGPDGGDKGGALVCCGTPEEVAHCKKSITGQYLKAKLAQ